jgi:hypothetical protein
MASTATDVTNALREFGTGVETHGRALGSSVRHLMLVANVNELPSARIARDIQIPPTILLGWIFGALRASTAILGVEAGDPDPRAGRVAGDFVIVDRSLTRC